MLSMDSLQATCNHTTSDWVVAYCYASAFPAQHSEGKLCQSPYASEPLMPARRLSEGDHYKLLLLLQLTVKPCLELAVKPYLQPLQNMLQ